jgi:hypothetical protein
MGVMANKVKQQAKSKWAGEQLPQKRLLANRL